jgi:hypothetical protein
MSRSLRILRQGVLGMAVAGALGFGASQAFAGPRLAPPDYICIPNDPYWSDIRCNNNCVSRGYSGGQCNTGYTLCECYSNPPIWGEP